MTQDHKAKALEIFDAGRFDEGINTVSYAFVYEDVNLIESALSTPHPDTVLADELAKRLTDILSVVDSEPKYDHIMTEIYNAESALEKYRKARS